MPSKITTRSWLVALLDGLFLAALALFVIAGRDSVPFHGDESTFIAMSRDYDLLVHHHDLAQVRLHDPVQFSYEQHLRMLNGSVNPLAIGLAWDVAGLSVDDLNAFWSWDPIEPPYAGDQWLSNVAAGALPGDHLLRVARTPSTIFTALSVALVFVMTWAVTRRRSANPLVAHGAGWVASLIYATNPAVLLNGRRAMQEGALLFSSALLIVVALHVVTVQRRGTRWRALAAWYVALGVAGGFAVASKHTGAVMVAAVLLALWLEPYVRGSGGPRFSARNAARHNQNLVALALVTFLAAELFFPVWWYVPTILLLAGLIILFFSSGAGVDGWRFWVPRGVSVALLLLATSMTAKVWFDTVAAPLDILAERSRLMEGQVKRTGGQGGPEDRIERLVDQAFFAPGEYYEDPSWADLEESQQQIAAYERSWLAGRGGGVVWGALLIGLVAVGLVVLGAAWRDGPTLVLLSWLALVVLALLANPLPWQRYFIVLHAPLAVIAGLGAAQAAVWAMRWARAAGRVSTRWLTADR